MEAAEYDTMARLEDTYWWYRALRALVKQGLEAELADRSCPRILDDGCGTGGAMAAIARVGPGGVVVGIDVASRALRYCTRRNAGPVTQASANCLPFRENVFDAVVMTDVLYHHAVDEGLALDEARRVLRVGGVLAVNVPAFEWLRGAHDAAVHTARRYQRAQLRTLLRTHGFEVRSVRYWNTLLLPVAFAVRRLRPSASDGATSDLRRLPVLFNALLTRVLMAEQWLGARVELPFGTSLFGIAAKR